MTGRLVTVEGIDGAGKSTVVDRLAERFPGATVTREPSEGWYGELVTDAVERDRGGALSDLFLFMADHADHLDRVVRPALDAGDDVLCDRYVDSRVAYQAVGLDGVVDDPMAWIRELHADWSREPDRTVLLDVPVDVATARIAESAKFEDAGYLREVRANYRAIAEREERVTVVDAGRDVEAVVDDVAAVVEAALDG